MSDYVINTYVWNMGHDEADDLMAEIADVLVRRGYGLQEEDPDTPMRSIVALCPIDYSNSQDEPLSPEEIFEVISSGSRALTIPNAEKHETHRAEE